MGFIIRLFLLAITTSLLIGLSLPNSNHAVMKFSSTVSIPTTVNTTLPVKKQEKESHCRKRRRKQKRRSCRGDAGLCKRLSWDHHLTCCFNRWCVDIFTNQFNCGSCGYICKWGMRCCGGICVDIKNDPKNCGDCRNVCLHDENCQLGMCGYG